MATSTPRLVTTCDPSARPFPNNSRKRALASCTFHDLVVTPFKTSIPQKGFGKGFNQLYALREVLFSMTLYFPCKLLYSV